MRKKAGYEMGGALTCQQFLEVERKHSAPLHAHKTPQSSPFVNLKPPSKSEYQQERLWGMMSWDARLLSRSKTFAKTGDLCCIFGESVDSIWQGGIMKHYGVKCVLTDRCVWHQFYSSKVAPVSNSFMEDCAKSVRPGIPACPMPIPLRGLCLKPQLLSISTDYQ